MQLTNQIAVSAEGQTRMSAPRLWSLERFQTLPFLSNIIVYSVREYFDAEYYILYL